MKVFSKLFLCIQSTLPNLAQTIETSEKTTLVKREKKLFNRSHDLKKVTMVIIIFLLHLVQFFEDEIE